jgi:twinkle protein
MTSPDAADRVVPLRTAAALRARLRDLWGAGLVRGDSTGWPVVDELFTVAPGLVTVVTGWPGSGKSEWVDALAMNLLRQGWSIAYYSPENLPVEVHLSKLVEKLSGLPFGRGPSERIALEDADEIAALELGERVAFMDPGDEPLHLGEIRDAASMHFARQAPDAKRLVIIDPWNEVRHLREPSETETEYVSQALGMVRRWARSDNVHVVIVAHPAKQPRENGTLPVPKPDMIAGSQHWWNKVDQAITVWRDYGDDDADVEVHVHKVRFKHHGRIGMAGLRYDRVTGRYHEPMRDASGRVYEFSHGAAR